MAKIIVTAEVFDALRKANLLKTVHYFDTVTQKMVTAWGDDLGDKVLCELIDGETIKISRRL